jgi:hypothetical protein
MTALFHRLQSECLELLDAAGNTCEKAWPAATVVTIVIVSCLFAQPAAAQHRSHGGSHGGSYSGSHGGSYSGARAAGAVQSRPVYNQARVVAPVPSFHHAPVRPDLRIATRPVQSALQLPAPRIQSYGSGTVYAQGGRQNYGQSQSQTYGQTYGQSYGQSNGYQYGNRPNQAYGHAPANAYVPGVGYAPANGYVPGSGYVDRHAPTYTRPTIAYPPRVYSPRWHYPQGYQFNRGYPALGLRFPALGPSHLALGFGGARWFFDRGIWYRPAVSGYVVAVPPYGVLTPLLPPTYATINYGGTPYYYDNGVYYTEQPGQGYLVTPPPEGLPPPERLPSIAGVPENAAMAQTDPALLSELQVSPLANQTSAQFFADRADCSRNASGQSGFDPMQGDPADSQRIQRARTYRDAEIACLQSRGYGVNQAR